MRQSYLTVKGNGEARIEIRKSLFISYVGNVSSEEEALAFIEAIRKEHWNATHNCYAYIIGEHDEIKRSNDDGEPSGTAGRPILSLLERMEIKDTVIVVTRYFGGIMLGAGGLIRAYSEAAKAGIIAAGLVERIISREILLTLDYSWFGKLESELASRGYQLKDKYFAELVKASFLVPQEEEEEFISLVNNLTNGEAELELGDFTYIERDYLLD